MAPMSASRKLNALLSRLSIDEVIERILEPRRHPHQRVPIEMFRKLDPKLQVAIPIAHRPIETNPIAHANAPLTKSEQKAQSRARARQREAIQTALAASISQLPGPQ